MKHTFYNDVDAKVCAWLAQLANDGHISIGVVHCGSIKDIQPEQLRGYKRAHFFAGIGGWDYALRLAGWPDDRAVWTGSCPCQPFSSAGKRQGQADERHLWPDWFRLIRECRPDTIFGEQVASAIGHGWLDGVFADLEGIGYTCGAVVLGAHSVGAPHIRQRLWWCASRRLGNANGEQTDSAKQGQSMLGAGCDGVLCGLAESANERHERGGEARRGVVGGVEHYQVNRLQEHNQVGGVVGVRCGDGAWSNTINIPCGDGKTRRLEPSISPLVDGIPARVVRLRGYGNAIVPQVAAEFIRAFMECEATA